MTAALAETTSTPRTLTREHYERYLPMVRRIAIRLARRLPNHITVADLISSGWVGLMEACSRSDAEMPEEEFTAYASHRVRGAMLDYLRSLDPATRQARNTSRKVARVISNLTQALGEPPEEDQIAEAMGLSLDDYRRVLSNIANAGMTRLEMIDVDQLDAVPAWTNAPDEVAETRLMTQAVAKAIELLPERLQLVVALYYQEDCTLREIGAVLGVSESRACQLHAEAMHRLRAHLGRE